MKTKPILISISGIILLAGLFLFARSRNSAKPEKAEVIHFLNSFNAQLKKGNIDTLLTYFDKGNETQPLLYLINVLTGRNIIGKIEHLFNIDLNTEDSKIKFINQEFFVAKVKVIFSKEGAAPKQTYLTFTIQKFNENQFKIYSVKNTDFLTDYYAYKKVVLSIYHCFDVKLSPITLASFKEAKQLRAKYDSVIWLAHIDKKTFFYVVKGKWSMYKDIYKGIKHYKDSVIEPYKMGLVNPDLNEIIPPEYDLIHNISSTFPNLVEVEKDNKRGFYDLNGKIVIPVNYDQIFPIEDETNLAVLKDSDNYYYLKKDMSISEKVDIKISDFFSKIKNIGSRFDLYANALSIITEYNSRKEDGAIYIPPSYLVDLNIVTKALNFKNPLRKGEYEDVHERYEVRNQEQQIEEPDNWLQTTFYSIRDYFLGGRSEFNDRKNLVIIDKKKERLYTADIGMDYSREEDGGTSLEGVCDVSSIKAINDSLFEVKAGAVLDFELYDSTKTITGGFYYHYLTIKNNKLVELPDERNFGFTKYIKMDDSYLSGCYNMLIGTGQYDEREKKTLDHVTPEMLRYMKNEIYADYRYLFKDKRWQNVFVDMPSYNDYDNHDKSNNVTVDDSLTEIDKYNINFLNQKLKEKTTNPNTIAAK
jgi:hypothetical protein